MSETNLGRNLFLGYTPDNLRVYVDVTVRRRTGEGFRTIEHELSGAFDELAITGSVYAGKSGKLDSQFVSGGQCVGDAASVLADGGRLARGAAEADVRLIVEAWPRWHLNGMRAGCAHVEPVGDTASGRLDSTPECPVSGYRWGSAWLVEPLPHGLIDELGGACGRLAF